MRSEFQPILTETWDNLVVRVYENRYVMGCAAAIDVAEAIRTLLKEKERVRIVFASAPSQTEFLKRLGCEEGIDWSRVTAFQMDEYVGLPQNSPRLLSKFLDELLFSIVQPGEVHRIRSWQSVVEECKRYAELISQAPIDIVCMGIGENGHIAFNEPQAARFDDPEIVKLVELDNVSRQQQVNDGCFRSIDEVPKQALTLTIPTLLSAPHLFCIVPGARKRQALRRVLRGAISPDCPASILRRHPNCILYADKDAYGVDGR